MCSGSGEGSGSRSTNASGCVAMFEVCQELILHSGLASSSCLSQECLEEEDNSTSSASSGSNRPTAAQGENTMATSLNKLVHIVSVLLEPATHTTPYISQCRTRFTVQQLIHVL